MKHLIKYFSSSFSLWSFKSISMSIYLFSYSIILMIFLPCMILKITSFNVLLTNLIKWIILVMQSYEIKHYVKKLHWWLLLYDIFHSFSNVNSLNDHDYIIWLSVKGYGISQLGMLHVGQTIKISNPVYFVLNIPRDVIGIPYPHLLILISSTKLPCFDEHREEILNGHNQWRLLLFMHDSGSCMAITCVKDFHLLIY